MKLSYNWSRLALLPFLCLCLACSSDNFVSSQNSDNTGDSGEPDAPQYHPAVNQSILFEVSHVNHAWGYQLSGFYIDSAGQVFSFNYGEDDDPWHPEYPYMLTEAELMDKYSHNSTLVKIVDPNNVTEMRALIAGAAEGILTPAQHEMCDYGTTSYIGYQYSDQQRLYFPVTLYLYGDWFVENQSSEAGTLVKWLGSL